jgi:hypothetical protein
MVLPVVPYSEATRATGVAAKHWKTAPVCLSQ